MYGVAVRGAPWDGVTLKAASSLSSCLMRYDPLSARVSVRDRRLPRGLLAVPWGVEHAGVSVAPPPSPYCSCMQWFGVMRVYSAVTVVDVVVAVLYVCVCMQDGHTALIWAAHNGHQGAVDALIAAGADLNMKSDVSEGRGGLFHAAVDGGACLSVCLPVCLSACLPVCLSVYLSACT